MQTFMCRHEFDDQYLLTVQIPCHITRGSASGSIMSTDESRASGVVAVYGVYFDSHKLCNSSRNILQRLLRKIVPESGWFSGRLSRSERKENAFGGPR